MAQDVYKETHRRTTDELESDDTASPVTKRVMAYGWDGSNKVRIAVDASGNVKLDPTNLDTYFVQTNNASAYNSYTWPNADSTGTQYLRSNGSGALSWGDPTTAPAGNSGELQYNNAGAFGGASLLDYLTSGNILTVSQGVAADVPVTIQYVASPTGDAIQVMDSSAKEVWAIRSTGGVVYNSGKSATIVAGSNMYRVIAPASFSGRYALYEQNGGSDVWQMDSVGTQYWNDGQLPSLGVSGTNVFVFKGNGSITLGLNNNTVGANLFGFDGTYVDAIAGADYSFDFFRNAASGETRAVNITGYTAGDTQARTLSIAVGATVANQANFTGVGVYYFDNDINLAAGADLVLATSTGTKIGTATNQLLGFYGATPVDQPATVSDPSGGLVVDAEARTAIIALIDRIQELGLIA